MENRIYKTELIDWQKVKDLQPDNLKLPYNYENIKNSILKYGISKAYDVCETGGDIYWIDGHTRTQILYELVSDGIEVPKKLTANFCKVKDKKEAIEILLEVHNQKQNPIAEEVLTEWIEVEQLEVNVESLNIKSENLRSIIGNNYESERKINNNNYIFVELSQYLYDKLNEYKEKMNIDDSQQAIIKLIEDL
jgi:hypothetical protein